MYTPTIDHRDVGVFESSLRIKNYSKGTYYVLHSSGHLSVLPGTRAYDEDFEKVRFEYLLAGHHEKGMERLNPAHTSDDASLRNDLENAYKKTENPDYPFANRNAIDTKFTIAYTERNPVPVKMKAIGVICGWDKEEVIQCGIREGYVLSAPHLGVPGTGDTNIRKVASTCVFYKDTSGRFPGLSTTVNNQTLPIPNQLDYPGDDGLYIKIANNGLYVFDKVILFDGFDEDQTKLEAEMKKYDVHTSRSEAVTHNATRDVVIKAADWNKRCDEIQKYKDESRKLNLELEELKRLRTRDREKMDDFKSDNRRNSILDWLKAVMSWFGSEIKRFIFFAFI